MSLIAPASVSPGKLVIEYQTATGRKHALSVNLVVGAFPVSQSAAELLAVEFAQDMVAPAMPHYTYTALRWKYLSRAEDPALFDESFNGGFLEPVHGFEGPYDVPENYESMTLTIGGHGIGATPGTAFGQTRLTMYTGPGYVIPPVINRIPISDAGYEALATLAAALTAHEDLFADFYGQKAVANDYLTPQANAHWQRVAGL